MRLYGTTTSPFVRRVRVVALELGVPVELVSTATPQGDAELRRYTPLWKIPTAVFTEAPGERVIWDSHAIIASLIQRHGYGPLRPDGALDCHHRRPEPAQSPESTGTRNRGAPRGLRRIRSRKLPRFLIRRAGG